MESKVTNHTCNSIVEIGNEDCRRKAFWLIRSYACACHMGKTGCCDNVLTRNAYFIVGVTPEVGFALGSPTKQALVGCSVLVSCSLCFKVCCRACFVLDQVWHILSFVPGSCHGPGFENPKKILNFNFCQGSLIGCRVWGFRVFLRFAFVRV